MTNFKAGDVVKRVRGGSFNRVREGGVYTIDHVDGHRNITLAEVSGGYDPDMFILHKELHIVNLAVCHEVAALDKQMRDCRDSLKILKDVYEQQANIRQAEIDTLEASLSALKTKYNIEG
jgi:hypothetical protein